MAKAPRRPSRPWQGPARGALDRNRLWLPVLVAILALWAGLSAQAEITGARYAEPTPRYPHGVLGDTIEYGALEITDSERGRITVRLPKHRVFEDTAPRVVDATGDGAPNVVVVEADQSQGARLAIYDREGLVAATPFIGTRFRWLAPVAVADLDGDGAIELAYVDRPHLAKTLRVWRFDGGGLIHVTDFPGVTNHRIGEVDIAGGLRDCGEGPEMLVASAQWDRMLALVLNNEGILARPLGTDTSRPAFRRALACQSSD